MFQVLDTRGPTPVVPRPDSAGTADSMEQAVRGLVSRWYEALGRGAPVAELLPLLARNGVQLHLPGVSVRGHDELALCRGELTGDPASPDIAAYERRSPVHADVTVRTSQGAHHWTVVFQQGTPRLRTLWVEAGAPGAG